MLAKKIEKDLLLLSQKSQNTWSKFFKEDYSSHDYFLNISVKDLRSIAKKYKNDISYKDLDLLIKNKYHEIRYFALIVLIDFYKKNKYKALNFYLKNLDYVNNWDLVDLSAPNILGRYCFENFKNSNLFLLKILYNKNVTLWKKRIVLLACLFLIRNKQCKKCLDIFVLYLSEQDDLLQKALGWMLREMYKNCPEIFWQFVKKYLGQFSNLTLRYALEKCEHTCRKKYLNYNKEKRQRRR